MTGRSATLSCSTTVACCIASSALSRPIKSVHSINATSPRPMLPRGLQSRTSLSGLKVKPVDSLNDLQQGHVILPSGTMLSVNVYSSCIRYLSSCNQCTHHGGYLVILYPDYSLSKQYVLHPSRYRKKHTTKKRRRLHRRTSPAIRTIENR